MHHDAVVAAMEAKARTLVAAKGTHLQCFAAAEGQVVDV
jgi:hypothetical protein